MKHLFTLIFIFSFSNFIHAQCNDLFISEYVEGWSNNKALEIYNPTSNDIDLSGYSLSRYSNGGVSASTTQLEGVIEPYSTFVVGLDKTDPDGEPPFESPMWNGYYTYTDDDTGEEVTIFNPDNDLQGRVDLFVNPIYYTGSNSAEAQANPSTLYFNGNDALTLEPLGGNPVDIFAKIGEDPGDQTGWLAAGTDNWWTKDHTLIRKSNIEGGTLSNPTVFDPSLEWDSLPANTFVNLGMHDCLCNPNNKLIEAKNSFVIFPNPITQSRFTIRNNHAITHLIIYDHLGKIVLNKEIDNMTELSVNLSNKKKGAYLVSLIDNNGIKTRSIILK